MKGSTFHEAGSFLGALFEGRLSCRPGLDPEDPSFCRTESSSSFKVRQVGSVPTNSRPTPRNTDAASPKTTRPVSRKHTA